MSPNELTGERLRVSQPEVSTTDFASTAALAAHTTATGTHGAGTIASVAAATALITTHANSTAAHIGGAGTVLSLAAATVLITTHAGSTNAHGAGTVLSLAAATVLITTHAGSTDAHIGGAGTVLSLAAATVLITTHASSTDAHIGGAGTVLSKAAATVLIKTHSDLNTGVHGSGTATIVNTGGGTFDGDVTFEANIVMGDGSLIETGNADINDFFQVLAVTNTTGGRANVMLVAGSTNPYVAFGGIQQNRFYSSPASIVFSKPVIFDYTEDTASVADQVMVGAYENGAGHYQLAIGSEDIVAAETVAVGHTLPVRINGVTYKLLLG